MTRADVGLDGLGGDGVDVRAGGSVVRARWGCEGLCGMMWRLWSEQDRSWQEREFIREAMTMNITMTCDPWWHYIYSWCVTMYHYYKTWAKVQTPKQRLRPQLLNLCPGKICLHTCLTLFCSIHPTHMLCSLYNLLFSLHTHSIHYIHCAVVSSFSHVTWVTI